MMPNTRKTEVRQEANGVANDVASGVMKVDSVTNLSPLPSIEKVASFGLTPNPSGVPPVNPAVTASGLATSASPSTDPAAAKPVDSGVTSSGATGSDANALGSGFRPIKRSRLNSENHDKDVIVRDFEGVDLAGGVRRAPRVWRREFGFRHFRCVKIGVYFLAAQRSFRKADGRSGLSARVDG